MAGEPYVSDGGFTEIPQYEGMLRALVVPFSGIVEPIQAKAKLTFFTLYIDWATLVNKVSAQIG